MSTTMGNDAVQAGQRIRALREAGRWSLRDLVERAAAGGRHLSHTTISNVERGNRKRPSAYTMETLAVVLGWPDYATMLKSEAMEPPAANGAAAAAHLPQILDTPNGEVSPFGRCVSIFRTNTEHATRR